MPRAKMRSIARNRRKAYEGIKRSVGSKTIAAKIANKGRTQSGRKAMAKKAARTRARKA